MIRIDVRETIGEITPGRALNEWLLKIALVLEISEKKIMKVAALLPWL